MNAATLTRLNALQEDLKAVVRDGSERDVNMLLDSIAEDIADYAAVRRADAIMRRIRSGEEKTYSTEEIEELLGLDRD